MFKDKRKRKIKENKEVLNGFQILSKVIKALLGRGETPSGFLSTLSTICLIKSIYKDINV